MSPFRPPLNKLNGQEHLAAQLEAAIPGLHVGKLISNWENMVFESTLGGSAIILRVSRPDTRTASQVEAELAWIKQLQSSGISVGAPIDLGGTSVTNIRLESGVSQAVLFQRVRGDAFWSLTEDDAIAVTTKWGRAVGKMHEVAKGTSLSLDRPNWDEESLLAGAPADPGLRAKFKPFVELMRSLPKEGDGFGLIHADCHPRNFVVGGSDIVFFDFDDCQYHWFAYDIAVALLWCFSSSGQSFTHHATAFLAGYSTATRLSSSWLKHVPAFMRYRALLDLALCLRRAPSQGLLQRASRKRHQFEHGLAAIGPPL